MPRGGGKGPKQRQTHVYFRSPKILEYKFKAAMTTRLGRSIEGCSAFEVEIGSVHSESRPLDASFLYSFTQLILRSRNPLMNGSMGGNSMLLLSEYHEV